MENKRIEVLAEDGKKAVEVNGFPDTCPICHLGVDPRFQWGYLFSNQRFIEAIFQCPRRECRHLFIAYYISPGNMLYTIYKIEPHTPVPREFNKLIVSISSSFVNIFNQASQAEELSMSEIAGPGYRKALEFLIKDYAISTNPGVAEIIKKIQLAQVISDYVTATNIKTTAKRAAWLGNDETHYYRKWEDKDINDLKLLIELTVRWIESEELTRQYEKDMND